MIAVKNAFRVLTISCVYPNSNEPTYGIFVRNRLTRVATAAEVKVIAPVPVIDYSKIKLGVFNSGHIDRLQHDGNIDVLHPRWLFPPSGGAVTAGCLGARLLPLVRRLRSTFPFDVIDAHFGYPDGIASAIVSMAIDCPFTVTLRGSETMHADFPTRRRAMQWALQRASRVITVSDSLRRFAITLGANPEKIKTIPNGIDASVFYPRKRELARRKLKLDQDAPIILSAGYLIERKGHHRAIQALHGLRARGCTARLVIAGGPGREGRFEEELHKLVATLGLKDLVSFAGNVDPGTLAEWMSAADVLCLASTREGWPNVLHEAMGCGTPVVATDVGGVADMITDDGHGMVVPPLNPAALEAALERALSRTWDRSRISTWAQSRSWEQVGRETLAELMSAAAFHKRS